jgi:hypothetical protein
MKCVMPSFSLLKLECGLLATHESVEKVSRFLWTKYTVQGAVSSGDFSSLQENGLAGGIPQNY